MPGCDKPKRLSEDSGYNIKTLRLADCSHLHLSGQMWILPRVLICRCWIGLRVNRTARMWLFGLCHC